MGLRQELTTFTAPDAGRRTAPPLQQRNHHRGKGTKEPDLKKRKKHEEPTWTVTFYQIIYISFLSQGSERLKEPLNSIGLEPSELKMIASEWVITCLQDNIESLEQSNILLI